MSNKHLQNQMQWSKSEAKLWGFVFFIGTLTAYACRVSLPIASVAVSKDYGWSKTDSGTVLSAFFWGYASTQVLGGWLADRWGGENVLGLTAVGWGLITFVFPILLRFSTVLPFPLAFLTLARVLMGVSQGVHFPSLASLTARHLSGTEKSRMLGILMAGSHAGTVFCGSIGSLIMEKYGWEMLFYFIGGTGVLWWFYLRFLMRHRRREISSLPSFSSIPGDSEDDFATRMNEKPTVHSVPSEVLGTPLKHLQRNGSVSVSTPPSPTLKSQFNTEPVQWMVLFSKVPFWAAICAHYCGANAFFTLFSWMPTYFSETFPTAQGWVYNFVPNLAIVVTSFLSPSIAARLIAKGYSVTFVRKLMECSSQLGIALMLFAVSTIESYEAALFCITLALALRGLHHAGVAVNPQDLAPNHAGAVFGFVNTAGAIPGFVGVYIAGFILQMSHSWSYVFCFTGVVCLVGSTIFALFGSAKQLI